VVPGARIELATGLEWFFRLVKEPRRLWRRYLIGGGEFVVLVCLELMGWKKLAPKD